MLSRRSVRIKVMNQLYALSRDKDLNTSEARKHLDQAIEESYSLCTFGLFVLTEIAELSRQDAERRKKKHIKTEFDHLFTDKLSDNPAINGLIVDQDFMETLRKEKFKGDIDGDVLRKIYSEFIKEDDFMDYLRADPEDLESHRKVLLDLFRFFRNHDLFKEAASFKYSGWTVDRSMVVGTIKKIIKSLPHEGSYIDLMRPVDEEVEDFGRELLKISIKHKEEFTALINPKLENWDPERLAILDTILLHMALAEFIYFPTIPPKVTLNEYLDLSKMYSTAKSKEFVNGVLDRLMSQLVDDGLLVKEGRGLLDE